MTVYCIETPNSILNDDSIDIFETWIPSGTYHTKICDKLWQIYRYRGLGVCDRDEFHQRIVDRYNLLINKWTQVFSWYETNKTNLTGLDTATVNSTNTDQREDLPDTDISATETYLSSRSSGSNTMTYKSGMYAELSKKMKDDQWDPYEEFAYKFSDLFLVMI